MMQKKGYVVDLDGTLYKGSTPIPEALAWVREIRRRGIPIIFATNNSAHPPSVVRDRLESMGFPASVDEIITSSQVAASFLRRRGIQGPVLAIGERGLREALQEAGMILDGDPPVCVVQGIDRSFSYDLLTKAARAIHAGAMYVLTNADRRLPVEDGFLPGAGAIAASIIAATGVEPVIVGKPARYIMEEAVARMGLAPEEAVVVGDNVDTDIAAGNLAGMNTVLVLTGVSKAADAERGRHGPPGKVVHNLLELL
jgi:4-nitrophenyl phosphatase